MVVAVAADPLAEQGRVEDLLEPMRASRRAARRSSSPAAAPVARAGRGMPDQAIAKPARQVPHRLVDRPLVELAEGLGGECRIGRLAARVRCISAVRWPSSRAVSRYPPIRSSHEVPGSAVASASGTARGRARGLLAGEGRPFARSTGSAGPGCTARRCPGWGRYRWRTARVSRLGAWAGGTRCARGPGRPHGSRPCSCRKRPISRSGLIPSSTPAEHLQDVGFAVDHRRVVAVAAAERDGRCRPRRPGRAAGRAGGGSTSISPSSTRRTSGPPGCRGAARGNKPGRPAHRRAARVRRRPGPTPPISRAPGSWSAFAVRDERQSQGERPPADPPRRLDPDEQRTRPRPRRRGPGPPGRSVADAVPPPLGSSRFRSRYAAGAPRARPSSAGRNRSARADPLSTGSTRSSASAHLAGEAVGRRSARGGTSRSRNQ